MRRLVLALPIALSACGLSVVGIEPTSGANAGAPDAAGADGTPAGSAASGDDGATADAGAVTSLEASTTSFSSSDTLDLTQVGDLDWVFYAASPPERKANAGLIGGYTTTADAGTMLYSFGGITCTWSDGSPTATQSSNAAVQWTHGDLDVVFTVPAASTPEVFRLTLGGQGSTMSVEADLGDKVLTTPISTDENGQQYRVRYAVTFAAPPPATLTVKVKLLRCGGVGCDAGHFFAFDAATLSTP